MMELNSDPFILAIYYGENYVNFVFVAEGEILKLPRCDCFIAILARLGFRSYDLNMWLFRVGLSSLDTASHSWSVFKSEVDDNKYGVSEDSFLIFGIIRAFCEFKFLLYGMRFDE